MDLSFRDCFDDDEREGASSLSAGNERIYCPHCCEEVHRSTFYRHRTKYLLDEPSEYQTFDGEFRENEEFANCRQGLSTPLLLESECGGDDSNLGVTDDMHVDVNEAKYLSNCSDEVYTIHN